MDAKAFLKKLFKTGNVTDEEVVKFLVQEYFLKGYTLDDFMESLCFNYNQSELDAFAIELDFKKRLKKYCK